MPLTPEDVSNKRFTPVRLREGYDMGEVDQFLDEVEAELARLTKENEDLRARLSAAELAAELAEQAAAAGAAAAPVAPVTPAPVVPPIEPAAPEPVPAPVAAPEPVVPPTPAVPDPAYTSTFPVSTAGGGVETLRVETVAEASNAAARLLELATRNHDVLIEQAKGDADKLVSAAQAKAERLEAESRVNADRIEAEARQRASNIDDEANRRREQLFGGLEREKERLAAEVENLRAFEREYRSRLKTYFTQQLEMLNSASSTSSLAGDVAPKRLRSILGEEG